MRPFLNRFRRDLENEAAGVERSATDPDGSGESAHPKDGARSQPRPGIKTAVGPGRGKSAHPPEELVRFELGDFLHRIPQQLLEQGPHDTQHCRSISISRR